MISTTQAAKESESVALSANTFYGHVKSSTGHTETCSITLTNATAVYSCTRQPNVLCKCTWDNQVSTAYSQTFESSMCTDAGKVAAGTACAAICYAKMSEVGTVTEVTSSSVSYGCPNNGWFNGCSCYLYQMSSCPSGYSILNTEYKCSSGTVVDKYCKP